MLGPNKSHLHADYHNFTRAPPRNCLTLVCGYCPLNWLNAYLLIMNDTVRDCCLHEVPSACCVPISQSLIFGDTAQIKYVINFHLDSVWTFWENESAIVNNRRKVIGWPSTINVICSVACCFLKISVHSSLFLVTMKSRVASNFRCLTCMWIFSVIVQTHVDCSFWSHARPTLPLGFLMRHWTASVIVVSFV